jgi:integrase
MRTLQEAIDKMENKGGAGASLRKHLSAVGINEWGDITRASLYDFADHLHEAVAPGTAKTICAYAKSLFHRYEDDVKLPVAWEKILQVKGDTTRGTYLAPDELKRLEEVETKSATERIVLAEALIEAYTGARISDVMTFTEENFKDGYLTYTSQKTKVTATVPVSEKTQGWIRYAQEHREDEPTLMSHNRIIRRLCQRAGIDSPVKTRRGGVEKVTPKWAAVSSHSFRKSCATNMVEAGASINDAKICLGHSSCQMTERYLVSTKPNLSSRAMAYFL